MKTNPFSYRDISRTLKVPDITDPNLGLVLNTGLTPYISCPDTK